MDRHSWPALLIEELCYTIGGAVFKRTTHEAPRFRLRRAVDICGAAATKPAQQHLTPSQVAQIRASWTLENAIGNLTNAGGIEGHPKSKPRTVHSVSPRGARSCQTASVTC